MGNSACQKCFHCQNCQKTGQISRQYNAKKRKGYKPQYQKTPNGQTSGKNGNKNKNKSKPRQQKQDKPSNKKKQPQYARQPRPRVQNGNNKIKLTPPQSDNRIKYIIEGEKNPGQKYYIIEMQSNNDSVDDDASRQYNRRDLDSHEQDDDQSQEEYQDYLYEEEPSSSDQCEQNEEQEQSEQNKQDNGNGARHYIQSKVNIDTNLSCTQPANPARQEEERHDTSESTIELSKNQLIGLMYRMYIAAALSRD